jgi:hypothetical protein
MCLRGETNKHEYCKEGREDEGQRRGKLAIKNGQDKKNGEYVLDLPPHGQRKEDEKVHDEDGPVYRDVEDL